MKKTLSLILASSLILSLVSCSSNSNTTTPQTTTPSGSTNTGADNSLWVSFNEDGSMKRDERDAVGENGIVTSASAYASNIGLEILEAGGNAVDAAVAVSYALGVAEPFATGLGGGGFMIIRTADGEVDFIDYREVAPSAHTTDTWLDENGEPLSTTVNSVGGLAIGVPGQVAGMEYAVENFGSGNVTTRDIIQPSIDLAREGYLVGASLAQRISDSYEYMVGDYADLGSYYLHEDGLPYETGELLKNPDLADAMEIIADEGAAAMYTGVLAQAIVDAAAEQGSLMTMEDLANYSVTQREPVIGTYRGYQVISAPPPSSGGTHLIQMLNILENYDVAEMGQATPESIHLLSEVLKIAFADRAAYMADPDFVADVPIDGLLSKDYAASLSEQITEQSQDWNEGNPHYYGHDSTTSFSVIDQEGTMVTVTQTIECFFGSKVAVPGYGFILNDQLHDFSLDPRSVNSVEGGKKPLSSMSPTIILNEDGSPFMTLGSPGGVRIFPTLLQIIVNVVDHGMGMQEAVDTVRIFENGGGISYEVDGVNPISQETIDALIEMGHTVTPYEAWDMFFGGAQAALYGDDGLIYGAADPRRDGKALGF